MRRLLITGGSGTLGREVARQALSLGWQVVATYYTKPLNTVPATWEQLEIGDRDAVQALIQTLEPEVIVNTVAVQGGPTLWSTTADGAAYVALAAESVGARLVHISTDALFDGQTGPYDERARPSPVTPYGAAKAAAETAVAAIRPEAAIVRTSLIMNREQPDQHSRMVLDIVAGRRAERLFTDEYRCPVAVEDLAAGVLELANNDFAGIINIAGGEAVSRYGLGRLVARAHGVATSNIPHTTLAESGLRRPADVRLELGLARRLLKVRLRPIREYLGVRNTI